MSAKDFKFVSPGVFIEEIDNSQTPKSPVAIGPLVIGRSRKGPAYQPVRVDSFSEFVSIFGSPIGGEESSDVWRGGLPTAPTFAAYAAQAWLRNSSPLTFIRLLGSQSPDADSSSDTALAGWATKRVAQASQADRAGAYGLFLFNSSSTSPEVVDGTLAAIIYNTTGAVTLSGSLRGVESGTTAFPHLTSTTGSCAMVLSTDKNFTLQVYDSSENLKEESLISLDRNNANYIRKVINTNPTLTNSALVDSTADTARNHFLGQTFEREVKDKITSNSVYGMILRLGRDSADVTDAANYKFATQGGKSGWFFSQDLRNTNASTTDASQNIPLPMYDPASLSGITRLFRLCSLSAGEELQRNYKISIEDLQYSTNDNSPYGTFTLAIRDVKDSDNSRQYVERYTGLSLDPNSPNYIAKQIGDIYYEWNDDNRRLIEYGSYPNVSSIVRVEVASSVDKGQADPELLPFGVEGPIKFGDFVVTSDDSSGTQAATATVKLDDFTKIQTGVGAILSSGTNTGSGGIFIGSNVVADLNADEIRIEMTDQGLVDTSGTAFTDTHKIILSSNDQAHAVTPSAFECIVSVTDGNGATVTTAIIAARIAQVFKRDSDYVDGDRTGGNADLNDIFHYHESSWKLTGVSTIDAGTTDASPPTSWTSGGDADSVFEAKVVNTNGVQVQARGYNGGTHEWGNDGRYGGDILSTASHWKINISSGDIGGGGSAGDGTVTAGTLVGATAITTNPGGVNRIVKANEAGGTPFIVKQNAATTLTNLIAALNAETGQTAASSVADTLIVTNTADAGLAGNARTIILADSTAGALTVQGVANNGTQNFDGGSDDGDFSNGKVVKSATDFAAPDSPVTAGSGSAGVFMAASASNADAGTGQDILLQYSGRAVNVPFTGSVKFPSVPLRLSASDGNLNDPTEAYFGAQYSRDASSVVFDESNIDISYPVAKASTFAPSSTAAGGLVTSWYFSLDDLVAKYKSNAGDKDVLFYESGSRGAGRSVTAISGSYKKILDMGYDRFTGVFYGGFNGFDLVEQEPINQTRALLNGSNTSETNSSVFYSVKKAVDMFADPEFVEANILTAPGIRHTGLTTHMINTCESRGDALALIDPLGGYKPASENSQAEKDRITSGLGRGGVSQHVIDVGDGISTRNLNSSYGAVYYPWVRITDTISGKNLWSPPSVAALGAMSYSENNAALWFAPAGFNRGGLTEGAAGIPVTNVRSRLTSAERDFLYERNVNPIASFPNEGIVIFGQKTLQVTPSALDRINVRRLMIFVKKEISRIASRLLFDQNVEQTWSRFTGQVNPFLTNIKNNFGLDAFKVILDESTTTPDLIDRNTIYAKIFLKPTKAVEFFAIDFVITNSGAGFED
jgi:hypothetical protein